MAKLSAKCADRLGAFKEAFAAIDEVLGAVDDLRSVTGAVTDLTNANLLNVVGPTGVAHDDADRPDFIAAGNAISTGVLGVASIANQVAIATGNEQVVNLDRVKGATDMLLLANPGALFTLGRNVTRRVEGVVRRGAAGVDSLIEALGRLNEAIQGVDAEREEFEQRNRDLKETILDDLGRLEEDLVAILTSETLFVPQASVDTICADLVLLAGKAVPKKPFSSVMRAVQDVVDNLNLLDDVIEELFTTLDRLLNYESNFRAQSSTGLRNVKRKLLQVLKERVTPFREEITAIPATDDFALSGVARRLDVEFLWIQDLLCRDDDNVQKRIDDDPNAGAFGSMVSALSAIGLDDIEKFRDQITESIRRVQAAVVRQDNAIIFFIQDLVALANLMKVTFDSILIAALAFSPATIENAARNIESLFQSQGLDRLKSLVDNGDFGEYFDLIADEASSSAALAKCINDELDNFEGLDRVALERSIRTLNGITKAQTAQALAQSGRRSNQIGVQENLRDKRKEVEREIEKRT